MMASSTVKECESDEGNSNVSFLNNGKRVLRSAAIYGANGSGKSNIIAAMEVFKAMILNSFVNEGIIRRLSDMFYHFDVKNKEMPISMQMVFICRGNRYRYGFEVKQAKVIAEWLFVQTQDSKKESYCFKREGQDIKVNAKALKGTRGISGKTRSDALFLSTAAQFNVSMAMDIKEWFLKRFNILSGLDDTLMYTANSFMRTPIIREQILQMIGIVDSCIKDVDIKENIKEVKPESPQYEFLTRMGLNFSADAQGAGNVKQRELDIQTTHDLYDNGDIIGKEALNFKLESLGTTKLFALLGPFFDTIQNGGVLVIDEFGASLHTQLSIELLKLFYSTMNALGAQLVITTHDTNLLRKDLLRRDQIWFAEKATDGASDLYSLVEYKINQANSVRNDASFSKDYLLGRYGAIPYFGNLEKFIQEYGCKNKK